MKRQIQRIAHTFYSWMSNFDLKGKKIVIHFRFTATNRLWKLEIFRDHEFKISHIWTSLLCSSVFLLTTKILKPYSLSTGSHLNGRSPAGLCDMAFGLTNTYMIFFYNLVLNQYNTSTIYNTTDIHQYNTSTIYDTTRSTNTIHQ